MSRPVITVENLSKAYRIGLKEEIPDTLVGAFTAWVQAPWRNLRRLSRLDTSRASLDGHQEDDIIWALKDVSFDVQEGEVLGIIGRNGAGKSTLLKILSRITEPTSGRAIIRGRVSSLLEVGTGFHPELTGRENIYMNGTILGMTKREIDRKFDEIVDFSGVEKFLDTPIKRYSSGMKVRLAFAVAAHLEPEILIIDEVLAVGDAEFQRKCLGKMQDVARSGRTVLFVSHNMAAIESLCTSCMVITKGKAKQPAHIRHAISYYLAEVNQLQRLTNTVDLRSHPGRVSKTHPIMNSVSVYSKDSNLLDGCIPMGASLSVAVNYNATPLAISPVLGVVIKNQLGINLFGINNRIIPGSLFPDRTHMGTITCEFETLPLMPGNYSLDIYLGDHEHDLDIVHDAITFEVRPSDVFGSGKIPPLAAGSIYWPARFHLDTQSDQYA